MQQLAIDDQTSCIPLTNPAKNRVRRAVPVKRLQRRKEVIRPLVTRIDTGKEDPQWDKQTCSTAAELRDLILEKTKPIEIKIKEREEGEVKAAKKKNSSKVTITANGEKLYECLRANCGLIMRDLAKFKRHNLLKHSDPNSRKVKDKSGNPKYKCVYCGRFFGWLKAHQQKIHPEMPLVSARTGCYDVARKSSKIRKRVFCPLCNIPQTDWRKHLKLVHHATKKEIETIVAKRNVTSSSAAQKIASFPSDAQTLICDYYAHRQQTRTRDFTYEMLKGDPYITVAIDFIWISGISLFKWTSDELRKAFRKFKEHHLAKKTNPSSLNNYWIRVQKFVNWRSNVFLERNRTDQKIIDELLLIRELVTNERKTYKVGILN